VTPAALLDSQVMTALARLERGSLLGWVNGDRLAATLPGDPIAAHVDRAVRRLIADNRVELWDERWAPTARGQMVRRIEA
jgi:hypothetical protein